MLYPCKAKLGVTVGKFNQTAFCPSYLTKKLYVGRIPFGNFPYQKKGFLNFFFMRFSYFCFPYRKDLYFPAHTA